MLEKLILTQTYIEIGKLPLINNDVLKKHCLYYEKQITRERGFDKTDTLSEDTDIPEHEEANKIFSSILEELKNKDNKKYSIREYWAHIHEKNHSTNLHHHAVVHDLKNAPIFSGVYYIAAPKDCGVIVFQYPINQYEEKRYWIKPEPGLFILFPSTLLHYVTRNESEEKRISISFNIENDKTKSAMFKK